MIRAHHAPNPNHAVHSADVLSPPERHVQRLQTVHVEPTRDKPMKWGDVPAIRAVLERCRGRR